jgi:hypothetical protein
LVFIPQSLDVHFAQPFNELLAHKQLLQVPLHVCCR